MALRVASHRSTEATEAAFRVADRVVAVSDHLRREIQDLVDVPVEVIGNVVHPTFFSSPPFPVRGTQPLRLLAVGYHTNLKRFDLLLAALSAALARGLEAELAIVGEGPRRDSLMRQAAELGLHSAVRFLPMVSRARLLEHLEWCDALVSTSDYESFGLVIAEALSVGRPVVVTASGGPEGFVSPDLGIVVAKGDGSAIADGLTRLPEFLRSFEPSRARAAMLRSFGPDTFIEKMEALYEGLLSPVRHGPG